ncbi:nitrous oxide reductase accessory protein NosL [Cohnella rhizosphaerae]|uniref:Nitrous oxide reductase accessory protein NosL n=1 Tax=Cohnella rhizosphaerae TaxID=1457232 RepID=A0A9X4KWW3_9BACL|nr:nitrous oxide reductase accessory protein NosL [Cohnella rhizosphaerae]MDG0812360.1 nitrous oxide reductase accessory protein NosL [Cohnella rhizosphaerae]
MKKCLAGIIALLLVLSLLAGCGKTSYEPAAIDETVDKCPVCNMAVADDQFAVEIILKNKKALKFDDLGDLHVWRAENGTKEIGEQFVRDYNTKEWVKLSDATYVYDKSIRTPMAFNVISFKEKSDADAFVSKEGKGRIMTAKELESHAWASNEDMMKAMMEEHAGEMKDRMGMEEGGMKNNSDSK